MLTFSPDTIGTARLTEDLRAWLNARSEDAPSKATALGYECAALIARESDTLGDALTLIEVWTRTMKDQVRAFGVGVEHP